MIETVLVRIYCSIGTNGPGVSTSSMTCVQEAHRAPGSGCGLIHWIQRTSNNLAVTTHTHSCTDTLRLILLQHQAHLNQQYA